MDNDATKSSKSEDNKTNKEKMSNRGIVEIKEQVPFYKHIFKNVFSPLILIVSVVAAFSVSVVFAMSVLTVFMQYLFKV